MMAAVAAVTQQHVFGVAFTPAHLAAGVEQRLGPDHAALQGGQVQEHLREAGAGQKRLSPPLLDGLHLTAAVATI